MKKFYITTSIAYTNASPHLGHALELVQADVIARYQRILKKDVFFLTGTDEHGLKIEKTAKKEGKNPIDFVNKISNEFQKLTKLLNISNDDFIRTTDTKRHIPVVRKVWLEMKKRGDIYKKVYHGLYCWGCESFISQKDLVDGKCPVHKRKPEVVDEENYFFRFSKYAKTIRKAIEKDKIEIIPHTRKNEVLGMLGEMKNDVSFSRAKSTLKWGIEVPDDPSQIIYVWVDALLNYISALGYPKGERFKKYWPADVHCIGKDILKFHALIWPAMLLSLGIDLPKKIFVHGFISVYGEKMSKSLGNVVDPVELINKYGTDPLRYYLLREIPATEDGDFTFEKFKTRYNSELASGIGNLLARVRAMAEMVGFKKGEIRGIKTAIKKTEDNYKKAMKEFRFHEALKSVWDLVGFSDKLIEKEKPWEKKKRSPQVIGSLLSVLDEISRLLNPFLPDTAMKISKEIERDERSGKFKNKRGKVLFPRI